MDRRNFIMTSGKTAAITAVAASLATRLGAADAAAPGSRINHSVCKWCYNNIPLDDLCTAGKEFGLQSVELLMPGDFATLKKHGMTCAMVSFPGGTTDKGVKVGGIERSFNRVEHHDALVAAYEPHLKASAEVGAKQVICFSGNRDGLSDEQGLENCAIGLKRLLPLAEKLGITLVMELLNSKVNHKDYQCDHTAWGVELCKKIASPNFKLLYDIYHMQIMEGDIIRTIRENAPYIAHYHTAGNPGRSNLDDTQELDYRGICKAIVATGYTGYLGQEFMPRGDAVAALRSAAALCDVA